MTAAPEPGGRGGASMLPDGRRVAVIINSMGGGGAERVVSLLLRTLCAAPEVTTSGRLRLILLDDVPHAYPIPAGLPVHVLNARGSLSRSSVGLLRLLSRCRPDVTLSFLARANLAAVVAARLGGWRCVLSERVNTSGHFAEAGLRGHVSRALIRGLYPRADHIIAVCSGVADDLAENFAVPRSKLAIIHNPYDLAALAAAALEEPVFTPPRPYVCAMGRLTPNKNHAMLIEAFALSGIAEDLVILGEGCELGALKAQAAALGLADRVHFPGFMPNPHAIIARARLYASASNAEGFPNATAEAMALGRVVLATDCPSGPSDLLGGHAPPGAGPTRASHGLLTPVGDVAAFAAGLRLGLQPEIQAVYTAAAAARLRELVPEIAAAAYGRVLTEAMGPQRR